MGGHRIERLIKKIGETLGRTLKNGKFLFSNSFILHIGLVLGIILVIAASIWLWWHLPDWQLPPVGPGLSLKDRLGLEDTMRSTIAQIVGGIVVLIGLLFTWRQMGATRKTLEISQEGQITERFTRAIEQLGSDKLEIRLGGIYALERIARDSPRDHWPIMEVLTAFVREQTRAKNDRSVTGSENPRPRADIQAILTVIGRRVRTYENGEDQKLNLAEMDLRGADLRGVHFERVNLMKAYLEKADLRDAHLEGASLQDAHLTGARIEKANLRDAHLEGASLQGAYLNETHLEEASLSSANLQGAYLTGAYLDKAHGANINMQRAYLEKASLRHARLAEVNMQQAQLKRASLEGADLRGSQLAGANLEVADLKGAKLSCNLTRANLKNAHLEQTDLEDAVLFDTYLIGVDLSHSKNLHPEQINQANVGPDYFTKQMTKLPDYLPADLVQKRMEELRNLPD